MGPTLCAIDLFWLACVWWVGVACVCVFLDCCVLMEADGWGHTSADIMSSIRILYHIVYTKVTELKGCK